MACTSTETRTRADACAMIFQEAFAPEAPVRRSFWTAVLGRVRDDPQQDLGSPKKTPRRYPYGYFVDIHTNSHAELIGLLGLCSQIWRVLQSRIHKCGQGLVLFCRSSPEQALAQEGLSPPLRLALRNQPTPPRELFVPNRT